MNDSCCFKILETQGHSHCKFERHLMPCTKLICCLKDFTIEAEECQPPHLMDDCIATYSYALMFHF